MDFLKRYYAFLLAIVVVAIIGLAEDHLVSFSELIKDVAWNFILMTGILIGFFLTMLSVINSIDSNRIQAVRDSAKFEKLMDNLKEAIIISMIVIGVSIFEMFIDRRKFSGTFLDINDLAFLFLASWAVFLNMRFILKSMALLTKKQES